MKNVPYVVYNSLGFIVRFGSCAAHMVQWQANYERGENALQATGNDADHCVWEGKVMTKEEARSLGWTERG